LTAGQSSWEDTVTTTPPQGSPNDPARPTSDPVNDPDGATSAAVAPTGPTPPPLTSGSPDRPTAVVPGALRLAAIASLGAGAIHATAAGAHSEHRSAVVAFVVTAALQIAWGALALNRPWRLVGLAGIAINGAAVGGWVMAKTSGISFVTGLEDKESAQFADTLAAGLAALAVVGAAVALVGLLGRRERAAWMARPNPALVGVAAVATIGLAVPGMVQTGNHSHAGGGHGHAETAGAGHDHGAGADSTAAGHDHGATGAAAVAKPYDATLPVDLGGVPGVSAAEQAEAEALVTESLQKLPQFADIPTIEAMGYHSIGDGFTGHEHFIKWDLIADGRVLDADYPESLVFEVNRATGEKKLAAAMYMANVDDTLETVPDVGGDLVQWHVHDNLCYSGEAGKWRVSGVAPAGEECPEGTFRLAGTNSENNNVPMVHIWIVPHPCGPFAALEGVGAGQIAPGEERLCDHAHGAAS
jgi:hypothetical protein